MTVLSGIKRLMKSLPNIIQFNTWLSVELNSFGSQKISLFDPTYELPRIALLVGNLINFSIEEVLFHLLDHFFESFPVFDLSRLSIHV